MSKLCRPLLCCLLPALLWTGCSTPGSRARGHAPALQRLSPGERQLVMHGQVRPGMSREAVYVAWGEPDEKTTGAGVEKWIYRQRVTVYEPMDSYYFYGPYQGLGPGWVGRAYPPDHPFGGISYEGVLGYQPHVSSRDIVRIAEFGADKMDRSKEAGGPGQSAGAPVATTKRAADGRSVASRHRSHPDVGHRVSGGRMTVAAKARGHGRPARAGKVRTAPARRRQ